MKLKRLNIFGIMLVFFLAGCSSAVIPAGAQGSTSSAPAKTSQPVQGQTPACTSPAALTPAVTEGPFFKPNSPERTSLLDSGVTGTKLTLTGYVLSVNCQPVAHALLDFWQANTQGQYDNNGFTLRGHQYTDAKGYYHLETIIPGLYPGRTEHIHVKVQAPGASILTTQLFFPGVSDNQSDSFYDPKLLMNLKNTADGEQATYNFIINAYKPFY
jgi:protocatechuate 3,4-dioxygenase beta subunit